MPTATTRALPPHKPRSPLTAKRATQQFDLLPDGALVPLATAAAVLSLGTSTVRNIAENDPRFGLVRLGPRMTRVSVKGIRAFMHGEGKPK